MIIIGDPRGDLRQILFSKGDLPPELPESDPSIVIDLEYLKDSIFKRCNRLFYNRGYMSRSTIRSMMIYGHTIVINDSANFAILLNQLKEIKMLKEFIIHAIVRFPIRDGSLKWNQHVFDKCLKRSLRRGHISREIALAIPSSNISLDRVTI
jgi:hypothetical protein